MVVQAAQSLYTFMFLFSRSVSMTTKRGLITDSFKVVKKARRASKREKRAIPPPPQKGEEQHSVITCDHHVFCVCSLSLFSKTGASVHNVTVTHPV